MRKWQMEKIVLKSERKCEACKKRHLKGSVIYASIRKSNGNIGAVYCNIDCMNQQQLEFVK